MPLTATWLDLEIIILSEVREREISYDIPCMQNLKRNDTNNLLIKHKQTHRLRKQTYGYQISKMGRRIN